ncbi:MAG: LptF/LptG family permease [Planctomycetota bacterium]
MRLLSRYILRELLKVFLVSLFAMTFVVLPICVAQEAIRQNLGLFPILRLIPYFLPNALVYAVPGTILFATCSVYGRMSADNELVAAKSVGVSPWAFLMPGFLLGFLVSLGALWLNDIASTWGEKGIHRVVLQSVEQIAYGMLRTQKSYSTPDFSINVERVEGKKLLHPTLAFHSSDNQRPFTLTADEAQLQLNADKTKLNILLTNAMFVYGNEVEGFLPGNQVQEISVTDASQKGGFSSRPANAAMHEIPTRIKQRRQELRDLQQQLAADAAYQMLTGDFAELTGPNWNTQYGSLDHLKHRLYRLELVPWRRWANGFSCLLFVMVGAPLAIQLRNADIWTSFGLCFFPILLTYYPLLMYGLDRAKCGALPPYSIWLGNVVLFGASLWLIRKVMRH